MKGEIYQSDIEFTLREITAGQADEVIVASLAKRGIEATKARRLVYDLRAGNPVPAEVPPWPKEWRPPIAPDQAVAEKPRPAEKRPHRPKGVKTPVWIWLLALVCIGLVVALVIRGARRSGSAPESEPENSTPATDAPESSASPGRSPSASETARPQTPASVALLCQGGQLKLAGRALEPATALAWFREVLGPPARTNQAGAQKNVIYAFDSFGVLLHANAKGLVENIMLDYDALGGNDGAAQPFRGTIAVDGQMVRAETNPAELTALKSLGIERKPEAGILSGSCGSANFTFAYLKDTNRLSIVQVDL